MPSASGGAPTTCRSGLAVHRHPRSRYLRTRGGHRICGLIRGWVRHPIGWSLPSYGDRSNPTHTSTCLIYRPIRTSTGVAVRLAAYACKASQRASPRPIGHPITQLP